MENKPKVFKAIMASVISHVVFILLYLLSATIISLLIYVLSKVPILSSIINLLLYSRGDTALSLAQTIAALIAMALSGIIIEKICKTIETIKLSRIISGILITLSGAYSVYYYLFIEDGAIFAGIVFIVLGIYRIATSGKEE